MFEQGMSTPLQTILLGAILLVIVVLVWRYGRHLTPGSMNNRLLLAGKLCQEVKDVLLVKRSRILSGDGQEARQWIRKIMNGIKER